MSPFDVIAVGKAIFLESADALFLLDPDTDQLLDVNPMAERLTGYGRRQLLPSPASYWFRVGEGERGGPNRLRQATAKTEVFHCQDGYYLRTAQEGVWIPVNLSVARLHVQPKTLALITARDMREQRQTQSRLKEKEAALREHEGRLQAIMDNSPAVICVKDRQGRYLLTNRQYEMLFHLQREQVRGKTDFELFPEGVARLLRQNDDKAFALGKPLECEEVIPQVEGLHTYISSKFLLRDTQGQPYAVCGIATDITERKRLEEERDRFFTLSIDMLAIADFAGYYRRLNPAWEQTLGWPLAELMAKPHFDFVHPEDRQATIAESGRLTTSGNYQTISFENRYRCADGSYKWLLWTAASDPSRQLIYAAARDITQRKEAEKQLTRFTQELTQLYQQSQALAANLEKAVASERQAHQQLKKAQSQLVQSEKLVALGQMVAGVAHEINNPLAFVTNNIAVLQRDLSALTELLHLYQEAEKALGPGQAAAFQAVQECAERTDLSYTLGNLEGLVSRSRDGLKRIQGIVRDLRDFARLSDKEMQQVNLNSGIESTLNIIRVRAHAHKVSLQADLQPLPLVLCYPAKINQVVLNLVANAIDACAEGGQVLVRSCPGRQGVEIHVSDNGGGIEPAIRDKIFDPFFTTKPSGQGTGLGLSISHGIMADHGGRIEVESAPGQGAHFTLLLPLRPPTPALIHHRVTEGTEKTKRI